MIGFEGLICDPPYQTNVYYRIDRERKVVCVIDAAPGSFKALQSKLKGLEIHVFLTHGHWDHVADAKKFQKQLKAKLYLHRDDVPLVKNIGLQKMIAGGQPYEPFESDVLLNDGEMLKCGDWVFEVLHLPGHTLGSVGFYDKANIILQNHRTNGFGWFRGKTQNFIEIFVTTSAENACLSRARAFDND